MRHPRHRLTAEDRCEAYIPYMDAPARQCSGVPVATLPLGPDDAEIPFCRNHFYDLAYDEERQTID